MLMMSAFVICTSCESKVEEATVTRVYQPLVNGMVHTWLEVKFEYYPTANVVLPDDNNVWDKARKMVGKKVKLRKHNDEWQFIDFIE